MTIVVNLGHDLVCEPEPESYLSGADVFRVITGANQGLCTRWWCSPYRELQNRVQVISQVLISLKFVYSLKKTVLRVLLFFFLLPVKILTSSSLPPSAQLPVFLLVPPSNYHLVNFPFHFCHKSPLMLIATLPALSSLSLLCTVICFGCLTPGI